VEEGKTDMGKEEGDAEVDEEEEKEEGEEGLEVGRGGC
jgi:hypothetical protein